MASQNTISENLPFAPKAISLEDNDTESSVESEDNSKSLCQSIPHAGFLLATLEGLLTSCSAVLIKLLHGYDSLLLCLYDFMGLSILSLIILCYRNENPFPRDYRAFLLGDTLFSSGAVVMAFVAYKLLPLGDASVIIASTPIIILFLARIFLKEKLDLLRLLLVLLATVGLVLISQPTFLFGETEEHLSFTGLASAITALCSFSCAIIFRRKLKDVHFSVITFVYTTAAAIILYVVVMGQDRFRLPDNLEQSLYMIGTFLCHASCLIIDITALKLEQASIVSVGRLTDVVFAYIWQIVIFGEIPHMFSILGSVLVFVAIVFIGIKKAFEEDSE